MSLTAEAPGDWLIRLTASVDSCSDLDNWVGALQTGAIRLAGPPKPAGDYVDLYIAPDSGARDAVSVAAVSAGAMAWDLVVETNVADAQVVLEYPDLSSVPAEWALYLVDRDTGARQYMRTTSRYIFESGHDGCARHLRLEAVRETGNQMVLGSLQAMQTSGGVEISYTLSGSATVQVTILNMAGRTIRTLCNERVAAAGANSEVWNLVGDRGTRVPAGSYLCRVTARTESGRQASCLTTMQIGR